MRKQVMSMLVGLSLLAVTVSGCGGKAAGRRTGAPGTEKL